MQNYIFLSHPISDNTIGFGGNKNFESSYIKSINNGNSCNESKWYFNGHIGTHMDAPFHFYNEGKTVDSFTASEFIFLKPAIINYPALPDEIIYPDKWCQNIDNQSDILLLKTGFESTRNESNYWNNNPGLSPELAKWLRINRPNIRAIGVDFISITSFQNKEIGKNAHKAFLSKEGDSSPFIVIEDMLLSPLKKTPQKIIISPMRIKGSDGSPVTIIAEIS